MIDHILTGARWDACLCYQGLSLWCFRTERSYARLSGAAVKSAPGAAAPAPQGLFWNGMGNWSLATSCVKALAYRDVRRIRRWLKHRRPEGPAGDRRRSSQPAFCGDCSAAWIPFHRSGPDRWRASGRCCRHGHAAGVGPGARAFRTPAPHPLDLDLCSLRSNRARVGFACGPPDRFAASSDTQADDHSPRRGRASSRISRG
jgi:hypothetical protein